MPSIESRLELFRGQIEELQGKMDQALGELEGRRGYWKVMRGRARQMRGRARQAVANARWGASDFAESFQQRPADFAPYAGLFALGITLAAFAIFSPGTLQRAWDWLSGQVATAQGESAGFGAGPASNQAS